MCSPAPYRIAEDLTSYHLRHTFGCDCAAAGIDIDLLAKLMGHNSITVTSKYYLHLTDERKKLAAEKMEVYYSMLSETVEQNG